MKANNRNVANSRVRFVVASLHFTSFYSESFKMSSDDPPTRIKSLHLSTNSSSTTPSQTSSTSSHSSTLPGSRPTLAYILIRWLFRFVLGVFYSNVVVEGEEHITRDGMPTWETSLFLSLPGRQGLSWRDRWENRMLCANHSNSLTDALLLVTSVPPSVRFSTLSLSFLYMFWMCLN